jgi:hypothetical protein
MNIPYANRRADDLDAKDTQTYPNFGYMSRTTVQTKRTAQQQALEDEEDLDEATAPTDTEPIICQQYVVYSATFQVPTFYFTMHSSRPWTLFLINNYTYFNTKE